MGELCLNIVLNTFRKKERKIHIRIFGCVEGKREERKKERKKERKTRITILDTCINIDSNK